MKIEISKELTYEELTTKLSEKFPEYELKMRGKQFLIAKKTSTVGATIMVRKNKMMVHGNFPTMGGQLTFTLSIFLLGIILPLVIYYFTFHKKFKAIEKEVGDFLKAEYEL